MSRKGYRKPGTCPRCGAVPSHQRHQLRVSPPSFGEYERISDFNPVDAVQCPRCKEVFQVSTFEHDGDFVERRQALSNAFPATVQSAGRKSNMSSELLPSGASFSKR